MMAKGRRTNQHSGAEMGTLKLKDHTRKCFHDMFYYQLGQEITTGLRGKPTDVRAPGEFEEA